MALSFSLVGDTVLPRIRDIYEVNSQTKVVFDCPNRGWHLEAVLSGSLNLSATSNWRGYFGVLPQLLNVLDGGDQALYGRTLQQPWMGRQYWTGTEPMQFTLPLQFVSDTDAEYEVFRPAMMLLALLFPRQVRDG